ncbi:YndJ family protein [Bacillus sp. Marseille-P3800]|uniref:YndJ family protein n=1 Tax=Bacillus sp. Marseille-P3800 TaxID=2014782 RepID=UPI000C0719E5|nr:YndJ family protein [Bacillus sp. Marseille-P3800]
MLYYFLHSMLFVFWALWFQPGGIDLGLGFAVMVMVPLTVNLLIETNKQTPYITLLTRFKPWLVLFSIAGLLSLSLEHTIAATVFSVLWLIATIIVASFGFFRLSLQGFRDAEEVLLFVGCLYLAIGGGWFVLSALEAGRFLSYSQTIIDLTAIHFHYSAFVLPIVAGMFGRWLKQINVNMAGFASLAAGLLAGPFLVAIGIEVGPPLEPILVLIYIWFVIWFALAAIRYSFLLKGLNKYSLLVAMAILIVTMVLSYLYSAGLAWAPQRLSIPDMVRYHGMANAFGFALLSIIVWLSVKPKQEVAEHKFPNHSIRGRGFIQDRLFTHLPLIPKKELIEDWGAYRHEQFNPDLVKPAIRSFHEQTSQYHLEANISWHRPFTFVLPLILRITKHMKQLYLPPGLVAMKGDTYEYSEEQTTVWVRKHADSHAPILTAYYSSWLAEKRYNFIQLPLPIGVMSAVLLPLNDEKDGLYLVGNRYDRFTGVYVSLWKWTWKTPLREMFHLIEDEDGLKAIHTISVFRKNMLTIQYHIYRAEKQDYVR